MHILPPHHLHVVPLHLPSHPSPVPCRCLPQKRDVYAHLQPPWCDLPYRVGDAGEQAAAGVGNHLLLVEGAGARAADGAAAPAMSPCCPAANPCGPRVRIPLHCTHAPRCPLLAPLPASQRAGPAGLFRGPLPLPAEHGAGHAHPAPRRPAVGCGWPGQGGKEAGAPQIEAQAGQGRGTCLCCGAHPAALWAVSKTLWPRPPPPHPLPGTRITASNECARRSFLDERVAGDGSNDKAVKGTLTHNLIQARRGEGGARQAGA